jgi:hypothetical protein
MVAVGIGSMSDLIPQIGLALEAFKARQQDIIGLGHRAYKDLFAAANLAMLTSVVQSLVQQSYAGMITATPPRTSLLAAVSQQHTEIMAGFRVLTEDDGVLRALADAANAATVEAFRLIYAGLPKSAATSASAASAGTSGVALEQSPAKTAKRSVRKPAAKKPRTGKDAVPPDAGAGR